MRMDTPLWTILKEKYGFLIHELQIPKNTWQQFKQDYFPEFILKYFPIKTKTKLSDDWLSTTINNSLYEVLMVDMWYISLRKNGKIIFEKRRFEDKELLDLIK